MSTWGQGSTRAWRKARIEVLKRDHERCQLNYAHCIGMATEVDHIDNIAKTTQARHDANDIAGLQSVCRPCHQAKTNREARDGRRPPDWRRDAEPHPGLT